MYWGASGDVPNSTTPWLSSDVTGAPAAEGTVAGRSREDFRRPAASVANGTAFCSKRAEAGVRARQ
jgi:hypothetical protein